MDSHHESHDHVGKDESARQGGEKADVYAAGERVWMESTQRARAKLFKPLLRILVAAQVTPNHLTFLSLVAGLAFSPLYFWSPPWAFVALALHVFIDGLDGPLARFKGTASRSGSFTDSMADQFVIAATTLTLMYAQVVDMVPGVIYILTYTVVVFFAMARNLLDTPYSWLFRPRFTVYAWFLVETYWWPGTINVVLWISVGLLSVKVLTGFRRIQERL